MIFKAICLLLCGHTVFCANILYLGAVPSPSHHIWNKALVLGLVNKGHNVTYFTADEDKTKLKNYNPIVIEGVYEAINSDHDINAMGTFGVYEMMWAFYDFMETACKTTLDSKALQRLIDYPKDFKFDIIIYDITVGYWLTPLIERFNYPPTVAVTAFLLPSFVSYDFGNPLQTAYLPWYGLEYSDNMNFFERLQNFFWARLDIYFRYKYHFPSLEHYTKQKFGENIQPLSRYIKHISLVLSNTDPLLDYPQPMPPNIIPVGGLHTRIPKEIPKEYKDILDNAKHGVILFSLGTNIRSDKLNKQQKDAILGAFSRLKQTIIWKFESDNLEGVPKNVLIRKWLPQNDILSHPNLKLFIGHGGALSTQEAIYHGKPMILIPFIVDQYINAIRITDKKLGLSVDAQTMTANDLYNTIIEVLNNPIYRDNMKRTSDRYNDRTESPLERGIFWIEYALRHNGTEFLNPKSRDLSIWLHTEADIIAVIMLIALLLILVMWQITKILCRLSGAKRKIKTQ